MATINFLYRSTKDKAPLNIRLLFRLEDKDYVLGAKTKFEVTKHYWNKQHNLKRIKDLELINLQSEVNNELNKIENYILSSFNTLSNDAIIKFVSKEWLQKQVDYYYNPPQEKNENSAPKSLIEYVDFYIEDKRNHIAQSTLRKTNVIKQMLIRYQNTLSHTLLIKDVNNAFKTDFEKHCFEDEYSPNTIARALRFVKTLCKHALTNGLEVNYQLDSIKIRYEKVENIYLTFEDLAKIEQLSDLPDYLENAKKWLIISCYSGQRVSDFLNFKKSMIRIEKGKSLLEFTQQKTNKIMTIPVHPKVSEVLDKLKGEFPRKISDQNYNLYIKEVAKLAGLAELVRGSKKVETFEGSRQFRKETGLYPKHELVSSHIGRRSFATNFYGTIPTTYLIYITGHSSEAMFLNYIGKSNKTLAMEAFNYF